MKVLVTGANGLVGSFICRELLTQGHQIKATRRASSDLALAKDIEEQIDWIETDLSEAIFWEDYLEDVDAVVHAAAIISFDKRWEKQMYKTNVKGTADLINTVLKTDVKNFLHVSSVAAIGRSPEQREITELDRWEDSAFDSIYSRAKYLQELEVWRGAEEGLKVKIINPSVVLGPGQWTDHGSTSVFKYAYDEKTYHPAGSINYVDVRDVATAAVQLLTADIKNERFILNADSIPYQNFFAEIALRFGKKAPSKVPKTWMLKVGVFAEWLRSRITGQQALITKETALLSKSHFHFKHHKIARALDFNFRPLSETLDWCVEELKKAHQL
jgi:dihydroflavonol-4-reductase